LNEGKVFTEVTDEGRAKTYIHRDFVHSALFKNYSWFSWLGWLLKVNCTNRKKYSHLETVTKVSLTKKTDLRPKTKKRQATCLNVKHHN